MGGGTELPARDLANLSLALQDFKKSIRGFNILEVKKTLTHFAIVCQTLCEGEGDLYKIATDNAVMLNVKNSNNKLVVIIRGVDYTLVVLLEEK